MKENGGVYKLTWTDITEHSWDDISRIDAEKLVDLNAYISSVRVDIMNTSKGYWVRAYEWNSIDLSALASKDGSNYTCIFDSYGELFGQYDEVEDVHDVYLVKLVYTLMNGNELYDKNVVRYCKDGNVLPDAKWTVKSTPEL